MDYKPLVSVVIPTYNRAQQTIAAVESVLAQTYNALEVIVVDDGSTDGSGDIIRRHIEEKASHLSGARRLDYVNQANQGPSAARNKGIERAKGQYIAFLDSDDLWRADKLKWQLHALEQFKDACKACITDAFCVDNAGNAISTFRLFGKNYNQRIGIDRSALKSLARSFCGFWISTLLVRADVIREIGGFNPDVSFAEDRDLFFRLSLVTPLAYIDMPLARSDRSISPSESECRPWEKVEVRIEGQQRMCESWLRLGSALPHDVQNAIRENLRTLHCEWVNWHLENGRNHEARAEVSRAMSFRITPRMTVKWALTWLAPGVSRRLFARSRPYL